MEYGHAGFKTGIIAFEYALDLHARIPYFQLYTTFQCLAMCITV